MSFVKKIPLGSVTLSLVAVSLFGAMPAAVQAAAPYQIQIPAKIAIAPTPPVPDAPTPVSVKLDAQAIPAARIGEAYRFDFADRLLLSGGDGVHSLNDVTWSMLAGPALPAGLGFENGVLSGTPTLKTREGVSVGVKAVYESQAGEQTYLIEVGGETLAATRVVVGSGFSCALTPAGGVKCWGTNNYGQLGNGTFDKSLKPVNAIGLSEGVVDLSAQNVHACAIKTGGAVYCWGASYRIGDGGDQDKNVPTRVVGIDEGAKKVVAGSGHTCAITSSNAVKCWGYDINGALGQGAENMHRNTAVSVSSLGAGVVDLDVGTDSACAKKGTEWWCWGNNARGQLGLGDQMKRLQPTLVPNNAPYSKISIGAVSACGITATGAVRCWGANDHGLLGNATAMDSLLAVQASGLTENVTHVMVRNGIACALQNGQLKCWGKNDLGQLGNGTTTPWNVPHLVGLSGPVANFSINAGHACGVVSGKAHCWGNNGHGSLGDGTALNSTRPVDVLP